MRDTSPANRLISGLPCNGPVELLSIIAIRLPVYNLRVFSKDLEFWSKLISSGIDDESFTVNPFSIRCQPSSRCDGLVDPLNAGLDISIGEHSIQCTVKYVNSLKFLSHNIDDEFLLSKEDCLKKMKTSLKSYDTFISKRLNCDGNNISTKKIIEKIKENFF